MQIRQPSLTFNRPLVPRKSTNRIVLHHTATGDIPAETAHAGHMRKGWGGIGYHYLIRQNGAIERGRPEHTLGTHARGANRDSIGIALAGNFTRTAPSTLQLEGLAWLVQDIYTRWGRVPVVGHSEVSATACPGNNFPWERFYQYLEMEAVQKVFKDIVGHWAQNDILWLAERGLIAKAEEFRPNDNATRAHVAVLLKRAIEYALREAGKHA